MGQPRRSWLSYPCRNQLENATYNKRVHRKRKRGKLGWSWSRACAPSGDKWQKTACYVNAGICQKQSEELRCHGCLLSSQCLRHNKFYVFHLRYKTPWPKSSQSMICAAGTRKQPLLTVCTRSNKKLGECCTTGQ